MSTNSRGVVSEFDFEELANQLLEQGQSASPADLHGCLCGLLAAGLSRQAEAGLAAMNQSLDLDLHGELAEQAMALYVATGRSLENDDFDFYPMLLDDDADIVSRTTALANWCRSFLAGYAHISNATAGNPPNPPGDGVEILHDLAAIADADLDDLAEDEESEKSYAELTEYIRFAVLNIYSDTVLNIADAEPGGSQLH